MEVGMALLYDYFTVTEMPEENCSVQSVRYMDIFLTVLYVTVFLVGITGNSILIVAVIFKRGVQRLIDVFIINLAASDFVLLITLPFWVDKETSGEWRSGSFLCKASSYIISVNMYCTIFLLTCMSADRYLAIMHPSVAWKIRTRVYINVLCICVWILSCLLGLPTLLSIGLREYNKTYCTDVGLMPTKRIGSLMLLAVAFFFPLLTILIFYCSITKRLCMKSIKVVFTVVATFVISWIPFNIFKLLVIISGLQELKPPFCLPYNIAYQGMEISSPFAFANSCANPFIYYFFDGYIRRAMRQCLCPWVKVHSNGSSSDTSDTRLRHSLSTYVHVKDSRRRRRSLTF
uniref:G-protein coupled receptors family 1 profile domain-containing protein n=1 Tax=Sphenodon punctatus TaxID=8508 RepID=A0A8D0G8E7_SPHPU